MKILDQAAERLRAAGVESPRAEARLLLAHALGASKEDLISGNALPQMADIARFESLLERRIKHEPFAYIVGRREFFSRDFVVGPGVLIPRPESELLIEEALRRFPLRDDPLDVLDLGTGSGCLLLSFLAERPSARGIGVDRSQTALDWAAKNADRLGLVEQAQFVCGDWATAFGRAFDVILVNPPYIKTEDIQVLAPEVAAHEPASALDGGRDGLDAHRAIAPVLGSLLSPKGRAFVEIGQGQAEAVSGIFQNSNVWIEGTLTDLARIQRCLVMVAGEQHLRAKQKKQL